MDNNTISVELTNKNEFLLAAHNSNKDAKYCSGNYGENKYAK